MIDNNRQLIHQDHQAHAVCFPLTLLLDDVSDPANVGAIFRLADALGVERLILSGNTVRPPNRRLSRTARSTDKVVAYEWSGELDAVVARLQAQGYRMVALELTELSVDLKAVDYRQLEKVCLILGAEQVGVRASLLEIVDYTVHIPMQGLNSSMNVAAACAIAVHEITRHLQGAVGAPGLKHNIEGGDEKTQK